MGQIFSRLSIPKNVQEIVSKIYREAVNRDLISGRSIEAVASATLYAAYRKTEIPRILGEIVELSRVDKREVN